MRHFDSSVLIALVTLGTVPLLAASCGSDGGAGGSGSSSSSGSGPACSGSQIACGATCVESSTDPKNCGMCGNDCGASPCCAGACVETASCAFSVSMAVPSVGWLNGGDYLTIHGAGFAAGMKVYIGDGRAAVRVLDATSARIKTPPGPLGPADLKVMLAGASATLKGGFQYKDGALTTSWQQKSMQTVRGDGPGVALMQDGRVLVAGGTAVPDSIADGLNSAVIYSRATDVVTPAKNTMSTPRWQNSAVTLLDGKVLVVGGACFDDLSMCNGDAKLADLFDPTTDTFKPTPSPMTVARAYPRAVLLPDGRVLIGSSNSPTLEVYDPDQGSFTQIASNQTHVFGFMTLLRDGRALLGGGDGGVKAVEVFDPDTNMITSVGSLKQGRAMLTAHTLPDGRVLVIGGSSFSAGALQDPLDTMEVFDPKTATFADAPYTLSSGRTWHASALVRDGTILAMGGYTISKKCDSIAATVDQIDPVKGTVTPFAVMPNVNAEWMAVTLFDGSVLGVGGGACGVSMSLPEIDLLPGAK